MEYHHHVACSGTCVDERLRTFFKSQKYVQSPNMGNRVVPWGNTLHLRDAQCRASTYGRETTFLECDLAGTVAFQRGCVGGGRPRQPFQGGSQKFRIKRGEKKPFPYAYMGGPPVSLLGWPSTSSTSSTTHFLRNSFLMCSFSTTSAQATPDMDPVGCL